MKKKGGKSTIVKDVMAQGFTARKAEKAVDVVFDCMKLGLWWGEPVEIPSGTIQAKIRKGKPRRMFQRFRGIQKGKILYRIVDYPGRRRVVKFAPNLDLDLTPLPSPPLSETRRRWNRVSWLRSCSASRQIGRSSPGSSRPSRFTRSSRSTAAAPPGVRGSGMAVRLRHVAGASSFLLLLAIVWAAVRCVPKVFQK